MRSAFVNRPMGLLFIAAVAGLSYFLAVSMVVLPVAAESASEDAAKENAAAAPAPDAASKTATDVENGKPETAAGSAKADTAEKEDENVNIYDRWAHKKVKRERRKILPPHELAKANPEHHVVVCEGGCMERESEEIVYMERKDARGPIHISEFEFTAGSAHDEAAAKDGNVVKNIVRCVGGCYAGTTTIYDAADEVAGSWSTEVKKASNSGKPAVINERWYERMNDSAE